MCGYSMFISVIDACRCRLSLSGHPVVHWSSRRVHKRTLSWMQSPQSPRSLTHTWMIRWDIMPVGRLVA